MALTKVTQQVSSTPGISDSSDATAITITSGENIGIGTTSPDEKLDVAGNVVVNNGGFYKFGDGTVRIYGETSSDIMSFVTNDSERMRIDSSGNVGIGTTSAANKLDVNGAIRLMATGTDNDSHILYFNNSACAIARDANDLELHAYNAMVFGVSNTAYPSSTERMRIDSSGNVTKANNCTFSATATAQTNLSTGTPVTHDIGFGTENWDIGSNFNTSTGIFTAPVTGKYFLNANVRLNQVDTAIYYFRIIIATSNRTFATIVPASATYNSDPDFLNNQAVFIADMDANDTAKVQYQAHGGAAQVDVSSSTFESYFQGYLLG